MREVKSDILAKKGTESASAPLFIRQGLQRSPNCCSVRTPVAEKRGDFMDSGLWISGAARETACILFYKNTRTCLFGGLVMWFGVFLRPVIFPGFVLSLCAFGKSSCQNLIP